jgi:hypothetical protein
MQLLQELLSGAVTACHDKKRMENFGGQATHAQRAALSTVCRCASNGESFAKLL